MDVMGKKGVFYARVLTMLLQKNNLGAGRIMARGVGARYLTLGVRASDPTAVDKVTRLDEQFAYAAKVRHCMIVRDGGLILFQIELPESYWQSFTRDDIGAFGLPANTIGIAENKIAVEFNFDYNAHVGMFGSTGSGKSEAVKSALVGIAKSKTPDDTSIVICDTNGDYDEFNNLAHLAYPVVRLPNDLKQALQFVNQELTHRTAENIKDAKEWIVVIEEANDGYGMLSDRQNLAAIQNLARSGRKYNMHLVLATQKPSHKSLAGILDNLLNRFIGQVSDKGVSYQLTGQGGMNANKLTGKGDVLHIENGVSIRFQVARATQSDFASLPRAEVARPRTENKPIVDLPADPPEQPAGRPKSLVIDDPRLLAYYLYCENYKKNISVRQAAKVLGASYDRHKLYKDFAFETNKYLRELHWRESRKRRVS